MRNHEKVAYAMGVLAALSGCADGAHPPPPIVENIPAGWNCLSVPSAFDGVATIFRVTPDGTKYTVANVQTNVELLQAPWIQPTATKKQNLSAGIVAQLIGLPVSGSASASNQYVVQQSFGDAQEVNTTDDSVAGVKKAFYQRTNLDPNQKYYLVRRAIMARTIQYDFDRDLAASFSVDIAAEIIKVKPEASYSTKNGFHYKETFPSPQNVCLLAERLPVPRPQEGFLAGAAPSASPGTPTDVPLFTRVGRD